MPNEIYEQNDRESEAGHIFAMEPISTEFIDRLRSTVPRAEDIALARESFGYDVPDDVLELLAQQQRAARPILEQYHLLAENTPTLVMARAASLRAIDEVMDIVTAMDLTNMDDAADFPDEYTCPRCAHRWSGQPNYRTGYGDKVYIPSGRVSSRTGRMLSDRIGVPGKPVRNFKYGRHWRGAGADKLPRGYGNKPIGAPIIGDSWRRRKVRDGKPRTQPKAKGKRG